MTCDPLIVHPLLRTLAHAALLDPQGEEDGGDVGTLNLIKSSGERLLNMINDLLDVAQANANQMTLQLGPLSIGDEVGKVGAPKPDSPPTPHPPLSTVLTSPPTFMLTLRKRHRYRTYHSTQYPCRLLRSSDLTPLRL